MPRTAITAQTVTSASLDATYEPANSQGNSYRLLRGRVLHVKNASGASVTVTIPTPGTVEGLAVADRTVTVTAADDRFIALGTADIYKSAGEDAYVDYSATTSVTVAVLDVP